MRALISNEERKRHGPPLLMQADPHSDDLLLSAYFLGHNDLLLERVAVLLDPSLFHHLIERIALEAHNLVALPVEEFQTEPSAGDVAFKVHVVALDLGYLVRAVYLHVHVQWILLRFLLVAEHRHVFLFYQVAAENELQGWHWVPECFLVILEEMHLDWMELVQAITFQCGVGRVLYRRRCLPVHEYEPL